MSILFSDGKFAVSLPENGFLSLTNSDTYGKIDVNMH